ncbi:la-related protein 1C isoform X2 [Durio zibethinus]|uniref:La-related protein 1C isoform X2 n=1 Tax=Durio zibethinus TaxID=66656 RepID=A0A6P5YIB0_DURZI|nr:la-related protein 1C isoform X2 [Durio zibethinus]
MAANINTANFNTSAAATAVNHSPSSPNQSRRATRAVSSPWTQIVRGESEPIAAVPLSPSSSSSSSPSRAVIEPPATNVVEEEGVENASAGPNGNAGKRPAWNKPSNGAAEIGSVMGAHMWPALSESARVSSKSSSDSPRASADGSSSPVVPVSQGSGSALLSSSSQKQVNNSADSNSNSTPNHSMPARQRSMKRNNNNSASNGGLSQPPPQSSMVEAPVNSPSSKDHMQRSGFVSQPHTGGNDHPHPRNSFRHRNGGSHPRGDGSHHQNYGGRRNHDHGNHDWNGRNFNSRDGHMQPRVVPRLMRHPPPPPPPNTAAFIAPPHVIPFAGPIGFPAPPPESLRGVPFVAQMPPVFFPAPEPQDHLLHASIVNQIDYYFSDENLVRDIYLRKNMDDQGWVPIKLIAGFKKVSLLTDNIQLILDALQSSTVVEVQGDKVRKRSDWMRWIMPPSVQFPIMSVQDVTLVARVQNISLDQRNGKQSGPRSQEDSHADGLSGRSSSGDFNNQSQLFRSEGTVVAAQGGAASNSK